METVDAPVQKPVTVPIQMAEAVAVFLWTLAADVCLYRGGSYVGTAVFLACVPAILGIATTGTASRRAMLVAGGLTALVVARLVWEGTPVGVLSAGVLVIALAMAARGATPRVLEGLCWIGRCLGDGVRRLSRYRWPMAVVRGLRRHHRVASVGLPVAAAAVFGSLFVLANPDWVRWSTTRLDQVWNWITTWLQNGSPWEVTFCVFAIVVGAGLIRPRRAALLIGGDDRLAPVQRTAPSGLYPAYRNSIVTLTALFAAYLTFEFYTLATRVFPTGFYYAGYAHRGAAWLTVALVLATVSISVVFGRSMRTDPRVARLRQWAWAWSALNFALVAAVYWRLSIYVGYNGLTRMRMVGYFGVTLVAIGFALVVAKVALDRSFWWLIRCQLVSAVITAIVYGLMPIDYLSHSYNVSRVAAGDLPPVVMIAVKPSLTEGHLPMLSLLQHENEIVRQGVRARLEDWQSRHPAPNRWMDYQGADSMLRERLRRAGVEPSPRKSFERQMDLKRFREYAMQWY